MEAPVLKCQRIESIKPDGNWDKPQWNSVAPVQLVSSIDGGKTVQETYFRAGYDDKNLYVIFKCYDRDIWGSYTDRDDPIYDEEVVEVFLAAGNDARTYFEFEFSPRNTVFDGIVYKPGEAKQTVDVEWNCAGLESAVYVDGTVDNRNDTDRSWIAEVKIPFAGLDVEPPEAGTRWRGNFYRIDRDPVEEYFAWSPTFAEPANFHVPERFGIIEFV